MATYKYSLSSPDGDVTVQYNISPDSNSAAIGRAIPDTTVITITGRAICRSERIHKIAFYLHYLYGYEIGDTGSTPIYELNGHGEVSKSIAKGSWGTFTLQLTAIDSEGKPTNGWFEINDSISTEESDEYLIIYEELNPRILEFDFERCDASGAFANEGQYLRCRKLKLAKKDSVSADTSHFKLSTILCKDSNGSAVKTVDLSSVILAQAMTEAGYTESRPTLFTSAFLLGISYTLTLTLGNQFDQVTATDTVMSAFARLHLSGASGGGVAIGMFSGATNDKPMFEVAKTHETHFYGPVKFENPVQFEDNVKGVMRYSSGEVNTGNIWIDGNPIYRYVVSRSVDLTSGQSVTVDTLPYGKPDKVISMSGIAYNGSVFWPIPYLWPSDLQLGIGMNLNGDRIVLRNGTNRGDLGAQVTIIIEYTKGY